VIDNNNIKKKTLLWQQQHQNDRTDRKLYVPYLPLKRKREQNGDD
jgi:hypothetical protein